MTTPPLSPEERMAQYAPHPNPVDQARLDATYQKIRERVAMTTPPLSSAEQAVLDAAVGEAHPAFAPEDDGHGLTPGSVAEIHWRERRALRWRLLVEADRAERGEE